MVDSGANCIGTFNNFIENTVGAFAVSAVDTLTSPLISFGERLYQDTINLATHPIASTKATIDAGVELAEAVGRASNQLATETYLLLTDPVRQH